MRKGKPFWLLKIVNIIYFISARMLCIKFRLRFSRWQQVLDTATLIAEQVQTSVAVIAIYMTLKSGVYISRLCANVPYYLPHTLRNVFNYIFPLTVVLFCWPSHSGYSQEGFHFISSSQHFKKESTLCRKVLFFYLEFLIYTIYLAVYILMFVTLDCSVEK